MDGGGFELVGEDFLLQVLPSANVPSFQQGCRNPVPWTVSFRLHMSLIQATCQPKASHPCDWIPAVHAGMTGSVLHAIALLRHHDSPVIDILSVFHVAMEIDCFTKGE